MAFHTSLLHRVDPLKLCQWKVYSFDLPLISGKRRQGLVFSLKTVEGEETWGEASPNSCRNPETFDEARDQLLGFFRGKFTGELFPSIQCGLEHALSPPWTPATAPLYAFLSGSKEEILAQADRAASEGYTTVKIKIRALTPQQITDVLNALKGRFRLRVDCSSRWTVTEANTLFSLFDPSCFDYIEDPTFELHRLHAFTHPFAIEKDVLQYQSLPIHTWPLLYGFILKPTVLGGKKGCESLIAFARRHRLRVVFSPAFESGLGLLQILSVAKHFQLLDTPIGLDTHRHLVHDLLEPGILFNTPRLTVTALPAIDKNALTELDSGISSHPLLSLSAVDHRKDIYEDF